MTSLYSLYAKLSDGLSRADWLVPTLARLVFAAVLLVYFLNAGITKLGDGIAGLWTPSVGAYAQVFPKAFEAVGYDATALSFWHRLIVMVGTWAELALPALIVLGLLTRLASLGMIGFVLVQSVTDVRGHGLGAEVGGWFDRFPDAIMMDQRALWVFVLLVLVIKGAGPLSFDHALKPAKSGRTP